MYVCNVNVRLLSVVVCCGLVLSACANSSGVSDAQACRTLQLAKGASIDLEMAVIRQDPKDLHKFLPPSAETVAKFQEVESNLNELADKLGSGDKADLARQLSMDLDTMLRNAQSGQMLSMETGSALGSDASQVMALCGF